MLSAEHVRWDQRPAGSYYTSSNLNQTNDNNTNNNIVNNAQAATASNPVTDNPMPSVKQETQVQNRDGNVGPQTIAGVLGISEPVNNSKIATISPTVSPISTAMQSAPADNPEERALVSSPTPIVNMRVIETHLSLHSFAVHKISITWRASILRTCLRHGGIATPVITMPSSLICQCWVNAFHKKSKASCIL